MIITEIITLNEKQFLYNYSDLGFQIERDGIIYDEAIDPIDSNRIYSEVENNDPEITNDEFVSMIIEEVL